MGNSADKFRSSVEADFDEPALLSWHFLANLLYLAFHLRTSILLRFNSTSSLMTLSLRTRLQLDRILLTHYLHFVHPYVVADQR